MAHKSCTHFNLDNLFISKSLRTEALVIATVTTLTTVSILPSCGFSAWSSDLEKPNGHVTLLMFSQSCLISISFSPDGEG